MAVKSKANSPTEAKYHCSDCEHSYDWHSKALDGRLLLCRCPFKQQGGKYCIFLFNPQCENFKLRLNNGERAEQI